MAARAVLSARIGAARFTRLRLGCPPMHNGCAPAATYPPPLSAPLARETKKKNRPVINRALVGRLWRTDL